MARLLTAAGTLFFTVWAVATTLVPLPFMSGSEFFPLAIHNSWTHLVTFSGGDYLYYMTETVIKDNMPRLY